MFQHSVVFDSPGYLLLLLLLPVFWRLGYHSLSGLGRWRRWAALGVRTLVALLIILALADAQYQRKSDDLAVVYLLDQSLSIPAEQREEMLRFVTTSIDAARDSTKQDRYAVIVFGRDAAVEVPLVETDVPTPSRVESLLDPEYSDLATAMQRAKALFPYDAAKRIVLVTDGNENLGDAYREARSAAASGVSIDVVPIVVDARGEVSVEKIDLPANARKGQPFDMRVVLNNDAPVGSGSEVEGRLLVVRKAGDREEPFVEQRVTVPPGKRVFSVPQEVQDPDFYTYEARFIPDDPAADGMVQNNTATGFVQVRGKGHVLFLENWDKQGEFDYLVDRLREAEIAVTTRGTDRLYTSLAELQRYDCVVLGNVSRSSGDDADNVASFSNDQIEMLVRNTRELGCGLVMIGGPESFGIGGWTNTELEKAMPVDFQIKAAKVTPVGALVLMMHAGEMPQSNYWQKRIAVESIRLLGPRDYCGLVQWNGTDQWLWGQSAGGLIRVGPNRRAMLGQVDRMQIGDMPQFDPAMKMAATAFAGVKEAAIKHMIIISDGDPTPPTPQTIRRMKQQGVKISTVAVPSHGGVGNQIGNVMQDIARQTGGKYYVVRNASALPKIYQREARRIARPLVYEPKPPASPVITANHEMLQGLETGFPPISGFVLTTVKENPLVEVLLQSPVPPNPKNSTVLATWTYGAGRSAVLTTDAGKRWAGSWVSWDGYEKFFTQLVRWAMRPTGDTGNFSVATDIEEGRTRVVITALDEDEDFLNDLAMNGSVVSPELSTIPLRIEQTAPGRYVAEFDSEQSGSYLIVINPGGGRAPIRTGVNVGYSAEYRSNETNLALLQSVAKLPPEGGPPGVLIEEGLTLAGRDKLIEANPFRRDLPPAVANRSIWPPLVLIACCAFFADVFVRRVQVNLDWVGPLWTRFADRVLRRPSLAPAPETMSRLRSRKQQVGQQIESRRGATRFESGEAPPPASAVAQAQSAAPTDKPKADKPASIDTPDEPPQESYTERLLKAKKNVWKEDDKK